MEFAFYLSTISDFKKIADILCPVDCTKASAEIIQAFFGDIYQREHYGNLIGLETLQRSMLKNEKFSRLYFGQEFCEFLIPNLEELKKAYYISRQLDWDFSYTTGCLTENSIEKVKKNLDFLAQEKKEIEVVVNDIGLLSLIAEEFTSLRPVLGRLLIKQKRLDSYSSSLRQINMEGIDNSYEKIVNNQTESLKTLNLSISGYRQELKKLGINRVDIDIVSQGVYLEPEAWNISFSCYYPWAYITGGRTCPTAAIADPIREFVVVDKSCSKLCREMNRSVSDSQFFKPVVQRGNTVFIFVNDYSSPYLSGDIPVDRIIFEPVIPI